MKYVYLDPDNTVREVIPEEARPISEWYNEEFASHCIEAPDKVEANWEYDPDTKKWYPQGERPEQKNIFEKLIIDSINDI